MAGAGSFRQLGVMGVRTFVYFEIVTTLALFVGLLAVNILEPGVGVILGSSIKTVMSTPVKASHSTVTFQSFLEHLLPQNIAEAVVNGEILQIVIFSIIFALAALAAGERAKPIVQLCDGIAEVMFRFTGYIMYLAPLGVCAAFASSIAEHGLKGVIPMFKLVGCLYLALVFFILFVFYPILRSFKIPVFDFVKQIKDTIILGFVTTSSESAYPLAMSSMEKFGVPRRITGFVLPIGYSFNLDGSTLYLAIASVFVAQTAGIHLTLGTQLVMVASLMLTTKGVAAVPRATMVILSGTLLTFGLPQEGLVLIMAVDTFMDMARTAVNLLGNCLATAVIARCEGIELRYSDGGQQRAS